MTEPIGKPLDIRGFDDHTLKILKVTFNVPPPVYRPSDDSLLMIEALTRLPLREKKVLDLGTGSGILGLYCAIQGAQVTASDIDELAVKETGRNAETLGVRLKLLVSDLFSNVPGRFDLILFNPPYLPSQHFEDKSIDGGPQGTLVAERFLDELGDHLEKDAHALLLLSSLNDPCSLRLRHSRFEFSTVAKRPLFFEELEVLRIRLRDGLMIQ
jgi:release factor glutamine methyltransferase